MNPSFERLMSQATRLTRSGKLKDAMAAIQAALRRSPIAAPVHTAPAPSAEVADVVDVQAREVADNSPAALADSFITGSHSDKAGTRDYKLYIPPVQPGPAHVDSDATASVMHDASHCATRRVHFERRIADITRTGGVRAQALHRQVDRRRIRLVAIGVLSCDHDREMMA